MFSGRVIRLLEVCTKMVDELKSSTYAVMANQQNLPSIIIKKSVMMSADELSMANWRPTQKLQKRKSKAPLWLRSCSHVSAAKKGVEQLFRWKGERIAFRFVHPPRSLAERAIQFQ
jgi:hypothetical protein